MEHSELLRYLAETFDRLQLRYAVTGSTATIAYGEPRFTNDIDVLVELSEERSADFLRAFPAEDFYVSPTAVRSAAANQRQFNVIHPASGLQADVIIASNSEFDRQRLDRSRPLAVLPNRTVLFATPEDVILKKLQYFQEGGSDKHLRDIAGVLRVQGTRIDYGRLEEWSARLGVGEIWSLLRKQLGESGDGK